MRFTLKFFIFLFLYSLGFGHDGYSKYGWSIRNYSLLYGPTYYQPHYPIHSFEFQYDRAYRACTQRSNYKGLSIISGFIKNLVTIGVKGMYTPGHWSLIVSRIVRMVPYLYLQGHMVLSHKLEFRPSQHHFTPGIGISSILSISPAVYVRPQFQFGYALNNSFLKNGNGLAVDLRIGIGINPRWIKLNRAAKQNQTE